jgi:hypothetical protein
VAAAQMQKEKELHARELEQMVAAREAVVRSR